jgi:hypothetical protein
MKELVLAVCGVRLGHHWAWAADFFGPDCTSLLLLLDEYYYLMSSGRLVREQIRTSRWLHLVALIAGFR